MESDNAVWRTLVERVGVQAPHSALGGSGSEAHDTSVGAQTTTGPAAMALEASACMGTCMPAKFARALSLSSWACQCASMA